jgi:hypothetical protein
MMRNRVNEESETQTDLTSRKWRYVRRDLAMNAVLSAFIAVLALMMMPPGDAEWSMEMQLAVASVIGILTFGATFVLLVLPEVLWDVGIR